jgi:hypothetical protein
LAPQIDPALDPAIILFPRFSSARKKVFMAGLNSVGFSTGENEVDLDSLRARLRKMPDAELARDIQLGEKFCSPQVNFGRPPRHVFVIQLEEARAELERRNAEKEHKR